MSVITLTDRVSVSVRAKNDSQSSSQKRDTGKNIAKALGNDSISDSLADQLGATTKPTITDENGNEWVSMADIIAAGKKMNENGAFEEETKYKFGNVTAVRLSDLPAYDNEGKYHPIDSWDGTESYFGSGHMVRDGYKDLIEEEEEIYIAGIIEASTGTKYLSFHFGNVMSGSIAFRLRNESDNNRTKSYGSYTAGNAFIFINGHIPSPGIPFTVIPTYYRELTSYGDMTTETSGGSLVDWTKPDDEIEEDIRRLHETWDVTEHEGSVTANGTYVMAGPIEYNDADPVG